MEAVEWSEILKWVPGTPKAADDQERQRPEYAGPTHLGQADADGDQVDAAS
jgi:hypothetical protein